MQYFFVLVNYALRFSYFIWIGGLVPGLGKEERDRQIFGLFDEIVENEPDYVYNIYSIVEKINQEVITWRRN